MIIDLFNVDFTDRIKTFESKTSIGCISKLKKYITKSKIKYFSVIIQFDDTTDSIMNLSRDHYLNAISDKIYGEGL